MNFRRLLAQLKAHEGFRPKPYYCTAGKKTIGYGRNLDDKPFTPHEIRDLGVSEEEISEFQASCLLSREIHTIDKRLGTFYWYRSMDDARKNVCINMVYNLGFNGFFGFKKMIQSLELEKYEDAAGEMLDSKWSEQVGRRAKEPIPVKRA